MRPHAYQERRRNASGWLLPRWNMAGMLCLLSILQAMPVMAQVDPDEEAQLVAAAAERLKHYIAAEEKMIPEFGEETIVIEKGAMMFYDGQYVPLPYKLERRGLHIYVNGLFTPHGPCFEEWPRPEIKKVIYEDPGDEWTTANPTRSYATYWDKKKLYLEQNYDTKTGSRMLAKLMDEAGKASNGAWRVAWEHQYQDIDDGDIPIVTKEGDKESYCGYVVHGTDTPKTPVPTPEELLTRSKNAMDYLKNKLSFEGSLYWLVLAGGECGINARKKEGAERLTQFMTVLTSDATPDQKAEQIRAIKGWSSSLIWKYAGRFQVTPEFKKGMNDLYDFLDRLAIERSIPQLDDSPIVPQ